MKKSIFGTNGKPLQRIGGLVVGAFAVVTVCLSTVSTRASILAYEGFNGYSSGQIAGQTVNSNTIGLTGVISGTANVAGYIYNSTGLTFSNLAVNGGSVTYTSSTGAAALYGTRYNGSTAIGTLYTSYLIQFGTVPTAFSLGELHVNSTVSSGSANSWFRSAADSGGKAMNGYTTVSNTLATTGPGVGPVYMAIGIFTNVGTALDAANPGIGTTYLIKPAQYDWFMANGGITEAALAATPLGINPGQVVSAVSSSQTTGTFSLVSGNALQVSFGNAGTSQTGTFDELRFATTLEDLFSPVPEPSTLLLGCLAFSAWFVGRAFRKFSI